MYIVYILLIFSNVTTFFVFGLPASPLIDEYKVPASNGVSASSARDSRRQESAHEAGNGLTALRAAGQASTKMHNSPPLDSEEITTHTLPSEGVQPWLTTRNDPIGDGQVGNISPATNPIQSSCGGLSAGANVSASLPDTIIVPGSLLRIKVSPLRAPDELPPMAVIYCFIELDDVLSTYPAASFLDHSITENIMGTLGATISLFPYQHEPEKINFYDLKKIVRAFLDLLSWNTPICPASFEIQRGEGTAFAGGTIKKGSLPDVDSGGSTPSSNRSTVDIAKRRRAALKVR